MCAGRVSMPGLTFFACEFNSVPNNHVFCLGNEWYKMIQRKAIPIMSPEYKLKLFWFPGKFFERCGETNRVTPQRNSEWYAEKDNMVAAFLLKKFNSYYKGS